MSECDTSFQKGERQQGIVKEGRCWSGHKLLRYHLHGGPQHQAVASQEARASMQIFVGHEHLAARHIIIIKTVGCPVIVIVQLDLCCLINQGDAVLGARSVLLAF